ncbi:hypothetical protein F7725_021284 [Dissostichus mawsoni]|uniref:Uncharacterized protein n=1 Tax=Dissostichus mawsoni TaxID=36200 RepID=A0A7J5YFK9_DISMA|nr:hypothetical protein F7725_021284 [Dissostichus mawsoni]
MLERLFQKLIFSFWRSSMFFWRTLLSLFDLSLFQFNELNSLLQVVDAGCQSDATRHTASISRTPSVERNKSNNLSLTRTSVQSLLSIDDGQREGQSFIFKTKDLVHDHV